MRCQEILAFLASLSPSDGVFCYFPLVHLFALIFYFLSKDLFALKLNGFYSLPNIFCSRPTKIPKILMRELTHAGVKYAQLSSRYVS